jgi:hypothetical protein
MLPRSCFRDNPVLSQAPGKQDLPYGVVYLMGAGMA